MILFFLKNFFGYKKDVSYLSNEIFFHNQKSTSILIFFYRILWISCWNHCIIPLTNLLIEYVFHLQPGISSGNYSIYISLGIIIFSSRLITVQCDCLSLVSHEEHLNVTLSLMYPPWTVSMSQHFILIISLKEGP